MSISLPIVFIQISLFCISASAQNLVLIGGNLRDDNVNVWQEMVNLAGGAGNAKIGVISASNGSTREGDKVIDNFVQLYGAKSAVAISLNGLKAQDTSVASLVEQQTGIFIVEDAGHSVVSFGLVELVYYFLTNKSSTYKHPNDVVSYEGPTQDRKHLVNTLRPFGVDSLVMRAIRNVLNRGGMVAGNAAFMGESPMIIRGESVGALLTSTRFFHWPTDPPIYHLQGGLGLLKGFVLDSELSEKGREVRLIRALYESKGLPFIGTSKGLGVDENTALVVSNPSSKPTGKVVTALFAVSGVFYVDVANLSLSSVTDGTYSSVPFSFLTVNDTVDLINDKISFATFKLAIAGEEWFEKAIPSNDIFSRHKPAQWRNTNRRLIDCKEFNVTNYSPFSIFPWIPRVQVHFDRAQAVGFGADLPNDPNNTYVASFRNMLATVKVVGT